MKRRKKKEASIENTFHRAQTKSVERNLRKENFQFGSRGQFVFQSAIIGNFVYRKESATNFGRNYYFGYAENSASPLILVFALLIRRTGRENNNFDQLYTFIGVCCKMNLMSNAQHT